MCSMFLRMSEISEHALVSIELVKWIYYFTIVQIHRWFHRTTLQVQTLRCFTVFPDRVTLSGAAGCGRGCISLVGHLTLLAGVVGTCVSTVGDAISDAVLTRTGGVHRPLETSLSRDVGTSDLRLRRTVPRSVLTKYDRGSGVRPTT